MARAGYCRYIPEPVKEMLQVLTMSSQIQVKSSQNPVYLALVYTTNKHAAELERCSVVAQLLAVIFGVKGINRTKSGNRWARGVAHRTGRRRVNQ